MGFSNRILKATLIIVLFTTRTNAQNHQYDIDLIYNKWALSIQESNEEILVFKDENELWFNDIPYDSDDNLKFSRRNNVFLLKHYGRAQGFVRCGNYIPKQYKQISHWVKGTWKLEKEENIFFLILERLRAEKGKKYVLTKRENYEVVNLDEDRMVLQKLVFEEFN